MPEAHELLLDPREIRKAFDNHTGGSIIVKPLVGRP